MDSQNHSDSKPQLEDVLDALKCVECGGPVVLVYYPPGVHTDGSKAKPYCEEHRPK